MLGGIGMNNKAEYTPEKVVDISNLSREDWLEYRKKGIGGSDVAAIMGISPFATIRDLFYNKTGVQPVIQEEEESNWVAKEVGHRLEDLVAEIFSKKTGLEVFPVRVMFRHPLYPFMLADVDFFVRIVKSVDNGLVEITDKCRKKKEHSVLCHEGFGQSVPRSSIRSD